MCPWPKAKTDMKLITVPDFEKDVESYIEVARKENVLITEQGKPIAKLVAIVDGKEISPEK